MKLSPYIITILASWVAAQGLKYIIAAVRNRKLSVFRQLYLSGNMPSAHSATVVSMATIVGLYNGINSAVFGVALVVAGVVMYDAVMVRRSVGEQGGAIQQLIRATSNDKKIAFPRAAKGHTPLEVLVGCIIGIVVGYATYLIMH